MSYKIKLLNTQLNYLSLDTFNFLENDVGEFLDFTGSTEYDVAIEFNDILTGEVKGLNKDKVGNKNYLEIDNISIFGRKTYWFITNKKWDKNLTNPILEIRLDVISTFGRDIFDYLHTKYIFLERAHFNRWKINGILNQIMQPNISGNSLWYFKDEFDDQVDDNSDVTVEDFDDKIITTDFTDPRKIGWAVLNIPSLNITNTATNTEVVIIGNFRDSYTTIEGFVTPIFLDETINNLNHVSKYADGTLNALYFSPFLFRKINSIDSSNFGKILISGKETFVSTQNMSSTIASADITGAVYNIQLKASNNFNLGWKISDIKNDSEKLKFNWKYELKIFNNNNFKTSIGFTGIDEIWELNLEQIVFNWEKIKSIGVDPNNDFLNNIFFKFRTKITSTTGVIDANIPVDDNTFYNNPNYQFQYSLNQIPIFTEQYQQYIRENKSQINVAKHQASENAKWSIASGGLNVLGGLGRVAAGGFVGASGTSVGGVPSGLAGGAVASSGVSGITGGLQSIATANFEKNKIQAQLNDKRRLNSTSGNPSVNYLNQIIGIGDYNKLSYIIYQKRHNSILEAKASYHLKFGYQINDNYIFNTTLFSRYLFNFIQVTDIQKYLNKLDNMVGEEIGRRFGLGIRLWNNKNTFLDYTLENWEKEVYDIIK